MTENLTTQSEQDTTEYPTLRTDQVEKFLFPIGAVFSVGSISSNVTVNVTSNNMEINENSTEVVVENVIYTSTPQAIAEASTTASTTTPTTTTTSRPGNYPSIFKCLFTANRLRVHLLCFKRAYPGCKKYIKYLKMQ